jgi:serine/threonine protein kinase
MFQMQQSSYTPTYENPTGIPPNEKQQSGSSSPVETNSPQQNDPIITMKKVRQCAFKGAEAVSYVLHKVADLDDPYGAAKVAHVLAEVIDLVILARANSKQLTDLTDRALQVACILDKVKQAPKTQNELALAVEGFKVTLDSIHKEASRYSGKAWTTQVMKVVKASGNQGKFEDLHKRLDRNLIAISACASMISLVNQELQQLEQQKQQQIGQGALEDKQALVDNIDKILTDETQRLQKTLSQSTLTETEKNHILGLQLQSCITEIAEMALEGKAMQSFIETQIKKLNQSYNLYTQTHQKKFEIEKHLLIPFYEVSINGNKIAQGNFGSIYFGQWCEIPVAVKNVGRQLSENEKKQFIREVRIMAELRNPYITQLYGCCVEPEACLIMEYMDQSSLDKVLSKKTLSDQEKKDTALCIAKGLLYLHTRGVLHRDLKTGNVLLNALGQAKLTDFGLSKTLDSRVATNVESSDDIQWQAPETFAFHASHTEEADIYSFGMVLWSICTRKKPFANFTAVEFMTKIKQGLKENIPNTIPEGFRQIISACWNTSPELRPSLEDIISQLNVIDVQPKLSMEDLYNKGQLHQEKQEYSQAIECYRIATEGGFFKAQTNYATMLLIGQGCTQDSKEAYRQMLKSAIKGHDRAQYNVAMMLERGDGTPQNIPESIHWYQEAAKQNFKDAAQKAQKLQEKSAYNFKSM